MKSDLGSRHSLWPSLLVVLLLAWLVTSLTWASETTSWSQAENLSDLPDRSFQTTMARNPTAGDLFVAWTEDGVVEREEILGRRWDRSRQEWLPTENLSQSEAWQRDGGPALIFDRHGHGLLLWTRTYAASQGAPASGHDVLWRAWNGAAWSPEAVLFHGESYLPGSPGTFGLIPVETPDLILLFITWGNGYRMTEYQNGVWSEPTPWNYDDLNVYLAQAIMDSEGLLHAAAYGENSRQDGYNGYFLDAYYLTFDGANWSPPLNLSSTDGVANSVGLIFDGGGRLHFLWSDPDSPYSDESLKSAIWERVYDGGTWTPNAEVTTYNPDQAISGFSLAADISGTLHLAWSEGLMVDGAHTDLNIYYQSGDGAAWGAEETVYTSTVDSRTPVLGVGDDGPYLVWQEVFWTGGPLYEHEVYASQKVGDLPVFYGSYLPLISR